MGRRHPQSRIPMACRVRQATRIMVLWVRPLLSDGSLDGTDDHDSCMDHGWIGTARHGRAEQQAVQHPPAMDDLPNRRCYIICFYLFIIMRAESILWSSWNHGQTHVHTFLESLSWSWSDYSNRNNTSTTIEPKYRRSYSFSFLTRQSTCLKIVFSLSRIITFYSCLMI